MDWDPDNEWQGEKEEVECEVEELLLDGENGPVMGVQVTCGRCGHVAEAFGTGPKSVRRALATLREECPEDEKNWYVADDGSDED